jgi:hypothetical protein
MVQAAAVALQRLNLGVLGEAQLACQLKLDLQHGRVKLRRVKSKVLDDETSTSTEVVILIQCCAADRR